ncbi:hypothetical protein KCP78_05525 [Salmonella enterica subsp. enterica]|nr:hypothetical protein KCP78_05525 [Salmonella enterica subsp. enterica]
MQKNTRGIYRRGKRLALILTLTSNPLMRAITEYWHKPTIDKHQPRGIDLQRQLRITLCGGADSHHTAG